MDPTLIINISVLIFLVAMALWWGLTQNVLNAWVHLVSTIIAAAMAVAMWEHLVLRLLIRMFPTYAWCIGLLVPFVIGLGAMRIIVFKYLRPNEVQVISPLRITGGAVCGLLSGVLASGLTVIGLGFLPLPCHADDNHPTPNASPSLTANEAENKLWIPVDRYAELFLSMLSTGAFETPSPLARKQPHLAARAAKFYADECEGYPIVLPNSIHALKVNAAAIPRQSLDPIHIKQFKMLKQTPGTNIVVVDTRWERNNQPDTKKDRLDIHLSHIRLSGHRRHINKTYTQLYTPVGYIHLDNQTKQRIFLPIQQHTQVAYRHQPTNFLAWVFVIPFEDDIGDLLIRQIRVKLPKANTDPDALLSELGRLLYYNAPE